MKKLLFFSVALLTLVAATTAHAASSQRTLGAEQRKGRSIMELLLFGRAVLIIKKFETMHHPKHWPYISYGHCVQPVEPYRRGAQLTEE